MSTVSKPSKKRKKQTAAQKEARKERAEIRREMRGGTDDVVWGTSPRSLGRVKAESEEARLATCPDCGYSGGRHSRFCGQP